MSAFWVAWTRARVPRWISYRCYRPLVHTAHRSRIAWHCTRKRIPVLAHEPSTRATTRAMLVLVALCTRRRRALIWLNTGAEESLAGQHARGRRITTRSFCRHVRRADRLLIKLHAGQPPRGWDTVHVFTRHDLADGLHFEITT